MKKIVKYGVILLIISWVFGGLRYSLSGILPAGDQKAAAVTQVQKKDTELTPEMDAAIKDKAYKAADTFINVFFWPVKEISEYCKTIPPIDPDEYQESVSGGGKLNDVIADLNSQEGK